MMLYVQRLCTLAVIIIANGEKKRRNYSWRLNNIHLSIGTISNEKCAKELWIDVTKCHLFPCGIQHRQAFTPLFVPLFRHEPQCLSHTNDNLLFRQPCRRSIQAEIFLSLFYQFFFPRCTLLTVHFKLNIILAHNFLYSSLFGWKIWQWDRERFSFSMLSVAYPSNPNDVVNNWMACR